MAHRIPDDTLQTLRERVSIVDVVSGHVSLKKTGRNHLGLCPFHSEKTPSFTVNDERGFFHCFGCGAGGNVFTFVMQMEHVSFPEAVELLAQRVGMTIPRQQGSDTRDAERQTLFEVNTAAQEYFRAAFGATVGALARAYLEQRGVTAASIEHYGIGFCPPRNGRLEKGLRSRRLSLDAAVSLGLLGQRDNGGYYERFWGRITFPIRDGNGRIIGFGGRSLGEQMPKYLNSPDSALFHKGHILYGLYEARQAIRAAERLVLVEGYMDAIALAESGIPYAVANLGTALTPTQMQLARRFASSQADIIICFDGDAAGQQAATRAFGICAEADVWGRAAFMPEGSDPDTFVRTHGAEAMNALLQEAVPLADFFLQQMDPGAEAALPARVAAVRQVGQELQRVTDPVHRNLLIQHAAQHFGIDEDVLRQVPGPRQASRPPAHREVPVDREATAEAPPKIELALLIAVARSAAAAAIVREHPHVIEALRDTRIAAAVTLFLEAWSREQDITSVLERLPATLATSVTAALVREDTDQPAAAVQVVHECITRLEDRRLHSEQRNMQAQLRHADQRGNSEQYRAQLQQANALLQQRRQRHHRGTQREE